MLTLGKLDAKGRGNESSIPLVSVSPSASNTRPNPNRVSSSSRLLVQSDDNMANDEHPPLSVPDVSNAPWGLRDEDPYECPLFWIIFAGLVLYTLATMIVAAWYLAWHIGPETYLDGGVAVGRGGGTILPRVQGSQRNIRIRGSPVVSSPNYYDRLMIFECPHTGPPKSIYSIVKSLACCTPDIALREVLNMNMLEIRLMK